MRYIGLVSAASLCAALCGCMTVGPDYDRPDPGGAQDAFVAAGEPVFAGEADGVPWWTAFGDDGLAEVVRIARRQNFQLAEALATLEAADARLRTARRNLLPQGQATGSFQRQQQAPASFAAFAGSLPDGGGENGVPPFGDQGPIDLYTVGSELSWEIDLFGRLRSQVRQQRASADAQAALVADTLRLVTARTAEAYVAYVEAAARADVAARNLESQKRALDLTETLLDMGELAAFDLARQQTITRTTRAQLAQLRGARAQAASALALLCGLTVPGLAEAAPSLSDANALPEPSETLALTDPATVLRRRPDVIRAERQLAASSYGRNVRVAELFPQVTLTGSASLTALEPSGLGDEEAFGYAYGPRLSWPIFSYPQLLARADAADAEAEAALRAYQRAVLSALTETDEALIVYARSLDQAEALEQAQESATRALKLAEIRYEEGEDSLLSFLDAQRTALQTEDQFVTARAGALRARIAVHRSLAD